MYNKGQLKKLSPRISWLGKYYAALKARCTALAMVSKGSGLQWMAPSLFRWEFNFQQIRAYPAPESHDTEGPPDSWACDDGMAR